MKGQIVRKCKNFRDEADKILWNANNGNLELFSGKQIIMKGETSGVKFVKK